MTHNQLVQIDCEIYRQDFLRDRRDKNESKLVS